MVGERLVVEGGNLAVAGRAVEADRLDERPVGLEAGRGGSGAARTRLELREEPARDPVAAGGLGDPHALDLRRATRGMLDAAAADRLSAQVGDEEGAGGRSELVRLGGDARARVEAGLRAA